MTDPDLRELLVRDPVVRRINEITTTMFDLAGVVMFALAAWAGVADRLWPGAQWIAAAMVVLTGSALAQRRDRAPKPGPSLRPYIPGPSDPGTVHIAGGR